MAENLKKCLVCEMTSFEVPLIAITYADKDHYICPSHLPILIHHPEQLVDKLPGAANLTAHEH